MSIDRAAKSLTWARGLQYEDGDFAHSVRDHALIAQAEATIALVEQARIANLIALARIRVDGFEDEAATLRDAGVYRLLTLTEVDVQGFESIEREEHWVLADDVAAALGIGGAS